MDLQCSYDILCVNLSIFVGQDAPAVLLCDASIDSCLNFAEIHAALDVLISSFKSEVEVLRAPGHSKGQLLSMHDLSEMVLARLPRKPGCPAGISESLNLNRASPYVVTHG